MYGNVGETELAFGNYSCIMTDEISNCLTFSHSALSSVINIVVFCPQELRIELDRLLAYKVTHPGASCWQPQDKEGVLLQAIIDLITTEDTAMVSAGVRLLT